MSELHGKKSADALRGLLLEANDIWGHSGDDDVRGGRLEDSILGGKGNDLLWGDVGDDQILGNTGNDRAYGSVGQDTIWGNDGHDWLSGGKGHDQLWGGQGNDELHGNTGSDLLFSGSGNDVVHGDAGNDVIDAGAGNDRVFAGSGDDYVLASSGNDHLSGGSGFDTLDLSRMTGRVEVDLGKHTATGGIGKAGWQQHVAGFEMVIAGDSGAGMTGDRNDNVLVGGAGDDWFRGKLGADIYVGGAGRDTFAFLKKDHADGTVDEIVDFRVGEDRLDVSDFLKSGKGLAGSIRLTDDGNGGTMVQGLVNKQWVDVVVLHGVDHASVQDLGMLV